MAKQEDHLDAALNAYLSGGSPVDATLQPYSEALKVLEVLRDVPARPAEQQALGRELFLQQSKSFSPPVSAEPKSRLMGWKKILRQERLSMTSIMGIVLAIVIAFGGLGTVGVAAQDSLPTEPLYAIKQLTEELRFGLTTDPQEKAHLLTNFVAERVREMSGLIENEEPVPLQTALRLENHLQLALQAAAQLEDAEMIRTLTRLKLMTQINLQTMERLRQQYPEDESLQLATRAMLQAQRAAEVGLEDPATFRNRQGTYRPEDAPEQPEIVPPGGEGSGSGEGGGVGPGPGGGDGNGGGGQETPGNEGGSSQGQGNGDGEGDGVERSGDGSGPGGQATEEPGGSEPGTGQGTEEGSGGSGSGSGEGSGSSGESGKGK